MPSAVLTRRLRFAAPVLALGVVAAGLTVPQLVGAADASAPLPPKTAAELLEDVATAEVDGLSGTVVSTSRLGLPELPSTEDGGSALTLTDLLAGTTTARVWKAGEDRARIAVDAPFAEYDVVRNGTDVWTFDSASGDVAHLVLPEGTEEPSHEGTEVTPGALAERLLSYVEPTTTVTVGRAEQVAGRATYELVLDPEQPGTLVDEVRLAVDGETSVPLRVEVYAVGQTEPAVEVGFTDVRFDVPDASVFAFTPPAGSTVTERSLSALAHGTPKAAPDATGPTTGPQPQVLGEGWTTVVEVPGLPLPEDAAGLLAAMAQPVEGGRVVTSALLSVLLLDDGRVLVGPVPAEQLVALARR